MYLSNGKKQCAKWLEYIVDIGTRVWNGCAHVTSISSYDDAAAVCAVCIECCTPAESERM